MLDIKVNKILDGKAYNVEVKAEGSAREIAYELHMVMQNITEKIPEVAERLCELVKED